MQPVPSNAGPRPLVQRLAAYGCTSDVIIRLDEMLSAPDQLDYLDLLPKQSNHTPVLTAVAAHQGTALLYLVDASGDVRSDAELLAAVRRQLANRSDPAWLGVVRPGSLEIFPIGFNEDAGAQPVRTIEESSPTAPMFFQSLVHGTFEENHRLRGTDYVFHRIFDLLTRTTNEFVPKEGKGRLDALEVLSMAGRALFFRFLIDRRIVLENERQQISSAASELKDAFPTAEKAAQTSAWLDATFNGDFLPLIDETIRADNRDDREAAYLRFFKRTEHLVGRRIFTHLDAILRGPVVVRLGLAGVAGVVVLSVFPEGDDDQGDGRQKACGVGGARPFASHSAVSRWSLSRLAGVPYAPSVMSRPLRVTIAGPDCLWRR